MHSCTDDYTIDQVACSSLSHIIRTRQLNIEDSVRFVRGESDRDTRPNKALDANRLMQVSKHWGSKPSGHARLQRSDHPPKNHGSCHRNLRSVTKSTREGQDCGQYMVVEADILSCWPLVICCPLGAVEKKGVDPSIEVRTIHNLYYPEGESTNSSFKSDSVPTLNYEPITKIARLIVYLANHGDPSRIRILKGDVRGAYRHLRTIATQVFRMAAFVKELNILLIDLAAPFGWAWSPPFYGLFDRAISWPMSTNSPASVSNSDDTESFSGYEWVDDHILVELDVGDHLHQAEATLRHTMLAILGSRSMNESKFSGWSSELMALGLLWNTVNQTVSIPTDKVAKAQQRVRAMLSRRSATKTELQKLLGSLRHVGTCVRTSKPFFQLLHSLSVTAPRFARIQLSEGALQDLQWFCNILAHGHLAALPVTMFGYLTSLNVELYMDSSNQGLAVLDPAVNKFIQLKSESHRYISSEQSFSINVREHLCMALALWTWGPGWHESGDGSMIHVKCWSDNISAVQWCNRLYSNNVFSQEINRAIGLAEAYFNLRVSAEHLPGSTNRMADAASRAWAEPFKDTPNLTETLHELFSKLQAKSLATRRPSNTAAFISTRPYCWKFGWNNTNTGNSASTVLAKLSHMSWYHRRFCGYNVGLTPGHQLAITGMRREDPPPNPKLPITLQFLKRLHKFLNFDSAQH
ncbi:hypothetical protein PHMEG_00012500 [Phytophthora megakarya]|uniref:Reverse transcriptase n=1 Tax=Phytophthora megakarya TaxID=4795 RepID=A0A225WA20_9STRA|nr:hypothetical protein PHMEG_00012500 [Phytophthora megakarya]